MMNTSHQTIARYMHRLCPRQLNKVFLLASMNINLTQASTNILLTNFIDVTEATITWLALYIKF